MNRKTKRSLTLLLTVCAIPLSTLAFPSSTTANGKTPVSAGRPAIALPGSTVISRRILLPSATSHETLAHYLPRLSAAFGKHILCPASTLAVDLHTILRRCPAHSDIETFITAWSRAAGTRFVAVRDTYEIIEPLHLRIDRIRHDWRKQRTDELTTNCAILEFTDSLTDAQIAKLRKGNPTEIAYTDLDPAQQRLFGKAGAATGLLAKPAPSQDQRHLYAHIADVDAVRPALPNSEDSDYLWLYDYTASSNLVAGLAPPAAFVASPTTIPTIAYTFPTGTPYQTIRALSQHLHTQGLQVTPDTAIADKRFALFGTSLPAADLLVSLARVFHFEPVLRGAAITLRHDDGADSSSRYADVTDSDQLDLVINPRLAARYQKLRARFDQKFAAPPGDNAIPLPPAFFRGFDMPYGLLNAADRQWIAYILRKSDHSLDSYRNADLTPYRLDFARTRWIYFDIESPGNRAPYPFGHSESGYCID